MGGRTAVEGRDGRRMAGARGEPEGSGGGMRGELVEMMLEGDGVDGVQLRR